MRTTATSRGLAAARRVLPRGQSLPEDVWRTRHVGILVLLWLHAASIPVFALVRGFTPLHAFAEGAVVPVAAALATSHLLPRRTRTAVASLGLLSSSAVLVHLSGGVIEMHFHFFVMVAVVALYQDWIPFLAAIAYVFVHHGLLGALDPDSVFNHMAARNDPWKWAGIHALFITGISAACLVTWRLNELMLDERRRAEDRVREESRIVETLHEVSKALAADLDTARVIQTVTDAATEATAASFGAFFYNVVDEAGESYMLYRLSGAPVEAFSGFGLPRNTEVFAPTFTGEAVVRLDDVTQDPRFGHMAPHYGTPEGHPLVRSYLAVPVRSRGGAVLGGLFFGHPEPARFTDVDERIVVGIAAHAAMAIDNATLYESERAARTASDTAGSRLALLAEVGRILTSSLEVDAVLRRLCGLVAPTAAEFCAIGLVEDHGEVREVAGGSLSGVSDEVAAVLRSGEPQAVAKADGSATVVVPMVGRERLLGVLAVRTRPEATDTGRPDLPFVEELARRAAVAVDNARLYGRQRSVAETLQHSLLPKRLPRLPGLATAASYLAGGPGVEVGGDWYDVIQLPNGCIGFVMGDVVGRGERAASLMGQLRNALRAYAFDGKQPAEIVELLNRLLSESGADHMATLVFGVLDAETGEFRYVNAGHPPPLLLSADRTAANYLRDPSGLPVGALPTSRYSESCVVLAPGETILLYTDGLVEDRLSPIEDGLQRLADAVVAAPDDLDGVCTFVVEQALGGRDAHDDAAILAVRLLPLGSRLFLHLPTDPAILPALRATLRRWLADAGASDQESYELLVACGEACTNAIRHATGPRSGRFDVELDRTDDVRICVRDHGTWRESQARVGGRGLAIIDAYVDSVEVVKGSAGTAVHMRRRLAAMEPVAGLS